MGRLLTIPYSLEKEQFANSGITNFVLYEVYPGNKASIAVGDMHGNAWKMLCCLFSFGLIYPDILAQKKLKTAYEGAHSSKDLKVRMDSIVLFEAFLNKLQPNPDFVKRIKLIFIGDTLCDRGNSDYMTLLVYEWMATHGIDFVVILSNHDISFMYNISAPETKERLQRIRTLWRLNIAGNPEKRLAPYFNSLISCPVLSTTSLVRCQRARTIYETCYLPRLRVADYDLPPPDLPLPMVYYTHAPNNIGSLQELLEKICSLTITRGMKPKDFIDKANAITKTLLSNPIIDDNLYGILLDFTGHSRIDMPRYAPEMGFVNVFGHIGKRRFPEELDPNNKQVNLDETNLGNAMARGECQQDNLLVYMTEHLEATLEEQRDLWARKTLEPPTLPPPLSLEPPLQQHSTRNPFGSSELYSQQGPIRPKGRRR